MSEVIKNRYEFVILFDVENGNPNGDPDAGNMPRVDPETGYGLVTDVCLKRKIRNYVETAKENEKGYRIYIKDGVPLNRSDLEAYADLGVDEKTIKEAKKKDSTLDERVRDFMCQNFYDIRTFGRRHDDFREGRFKLRPSSRTCAAGVCAQRGTGRPAGSDHHPCCDYNGSGCGEKRDRDGTQAHHPLWPLSRRGICVSQFSPESDRLFRRGPRPALGGDHQYV